jgi:hypothetical protein
MTIICLEDGEETATSTALLINPASTALLRVSSPAYAIAAWVAPMNVLEHHQNGLPRGQAFDLRELRLKDFFLAFLRTEVESRVAVRNCHITLPDAQTKGTISYWQARHALLISSLSRDIVELSATLAGAAWLRGREH